MHSLQRRAPQSPQSSPVKSARPGSVACQAVQSDFALRVRGRAADVYTYVSNPANLPSFCPAIHSSTLQKGAGPDIRSRWLVSQSIGKTKVDVTYEIVDLQPERRIVYAMTSDLYTGTEQTVFMPDPNDQAFTVVRCVSSIELNLWKRALQPFIAGNFKSAPEDNLKQLAALLSSAQSPIKDADEGGTASSSKQTSRNPFTNFFSGRRANSKGQAESVGGTRGGGRVYTSPKKTEVDSLGYYAVLGLDAKRRRSVRAEDVKSAFRKSALAMHPDKFSMDEELMADEQRRTMMEENYKKITRAYEVLKDPEQKRLYDEGRLLEMQQK